jgi:hypothetical protein
MGASLPVAQALSCVKGVLYFANGFDVKSTIAFGTAQSAIANSTVQSAIAFGTAQSAIATATASTTTTTTTTSTSHLQCQHRQRSQLRRLMWELFGDFKYSAGDLHCE